MISNLLRYIEICIIILYLIDIAPPHIPVKLCILLQPVYRKVKEGRDRRKPHPGKRTPSRPFLRGQTPHSRRRSTQRPRPRTDESLPSRLPLGISMAYELGMM